MASILSRRGILWVVVLAAVTPTFFDFMEAIFLKQQVAALTRLAAFVCLFTLGFLGERYKLVDGQ